MFISPSRAFQLSGNTSAFVAPRRVTGFWMQLWLVIAASSAGAAVSTWTGTGTNWNSAASWSPASVPASGDDLVFGVASGGSSVANINGLVVRSLRFSAAVLPLHNIYVTGDLFFTGPGILNDSTFVSGGVIRQELFADGGGTITFQNSATIGGATLPVDLNALGGTVAGGSGGRIVFENNSTASSAVDLLFTGLRVHGASVVGATGGELRFKDDAQMGATANFGNLSGQIAGAPGGLIVFEDRARASGSSGNAAGNGLGGRVIFQENAVGGGTLSLSNYGATHMETGAEAVTQFLDDSALNGTVVNYSGQVPGAPGGRVEFRNRARFDGTPIPADLGSIVILNRGSLIPNGTTGPAGLGGRTIFYDDTRVIGANVRITNSAENEGMNPTGIGGTTEFLNRSRAGHSTITNAGASSATAGTLGGRTFFRDDSSAESAIIVSGGGQDVGAPGGSVEFSDASTAANATLVASSGAPGGLGGTILLSETASGGTASVETELGGLFDMSQLTTAGTTLGSIEGAGVVALGSKALAVGGNALSTEFSGVVKDGGLGGGAAGSLTKVGAGTLTLSGANTFTGATAVSAGKLLVNGSLANTPVSVASGATLGGSGSIGGAVTVSGGGTLAPGPTAGAGTLGVGSLSLNSTSNLAFDLGVPGAIGNDLLTVTGNLILDGELDLTDLGGVGFGVYRLINYSGTFTDNGLTIGTVPSGIPLTELTVQTSVAGQVNLIISTGTAAGYWDGAATVGNNVVDGGVGNWNSSTRNWTDSAGSVNGIWGSQFAYFSGTAGAVTLTENTTTTGMQFTTDGYVIGATAAELTLSGGTTFRVNAGMTATINAPLTGSGSLTKNDAGKLILSGANTYTGGTFLDFLGGTLEVQSASGAGLGTGPVSVFEGAILSFTHQALAGANRLYVLPGAFSRDGGHVKFSGTASAGTATIQQIGSADSSVLSVALTSFFDNSSAGAALVTNEGGRASNGAHGGEIVFWNTSTAASATITNRGAEIAGAKPGLVIFRDSSEAGAAMIFNQHGLVSGAPGGTIEFLGTSSAGNAGFTNRTAIVNGSGNGLIRFIDTATGGAATFLNEGGKFANTIGAITEFRATSTAGAGVFNNRAGLATDAHGGRTNFHDIATAGTAQLNNEGGAAAGGFGGVVRFQQQSSADQATIANQGSAVAGAMEGGVMYFSGTATADRATIENFAGAVKGGALGFQSLSTAGSAQIINHGALAGSTASGTTYFADQSNAGAAIIANRGSVTLVIADASLTSFSHNSSAGTATIINESATHPSGAGTGGRTEFHGTATAASASILARGNSNGGWASYIGFLDTSRAGTATLTAEGSIGTGSEGLIDFRDFSDGENARVILRAGGGSDGLLSLSGLKSAGTQVGSIEGGGRVSLSTKWLIVGSNNRDTDFSGTIFGLGSIALIKNGIGTFTLSGANTYTGVTTVNAGTLAVNGSIKGAALVNAGATLKGTGTIGGVVSVFPGGIFAPGTSPGTITVAGLELSDTSILNFEVGTTSDLVVVEGDLTLDGILNLADAGGLVANGHYDLFRWTGTLTNNGLTIGTVPTGFNASDFSFDVSAGVMRLAVAPGSGPPPAVVNLQPISLSVAKGGTAQFTVGASGAGVTYQWQRQIAGSTTWSDLVDGGAYSGAKTATLNVVTTRAMNGDRFRSVVSNAIPPSSTSDAVTLTVTGAELVNISARTYCGSGHRVTIGGFVVSGTEPKRVLVRAVGPTLTTQGLSQAEVLLNPAFEVHDALRGNAVIATNDNWGDNANSAEITAATTAVGASALASGDTTSSALILTLSPGIYTFVVRGISNAAGIVLLEVYDTEATSSVASFVNISSRAYCTTGSSVTIGGFVIAGSAPKQVLLRAVGPTLATVGIGAADVLQDPTIALHDARRGNAVISANDNWSDNANAAAIVTTGARIGATPLASSDTKSSALLVTLEPGVYSFVASGKHATSGIVLVEVYDAD